MLFKTCRMTTLGDALLFLKYTTRQGAGVEKNQKKIVQ
jgi:hypothetical protein